MHSTSLAYRPVSWFHKVHPGVRHKQPYPNLPWLMSHHPNFMDHAEHLYGRRETWDSVMLNPESPTQHYPITLLLEAVVKLERKIRLTEKRNKHFAARAKVADECMREWMNEMAEKGTKCLESFQTPQMGPRDVEPRGKLGKSTRKATAEIQKGEKRASGTYIRKAEKEDDSQWVGGADHGKPMRPETNTFPFLRQRAAESPSSLDPFLSEWSKKHTKPPAEPIEVIPAAESSASSPDEAQATEQNSEKPQKSKLEKRKPARTMKEFLRQRPLFDAQYAFEQRPSKSYAKVDWETLRGANAMKGYDGKRALERKLRLKRGEDV